MTMCGQCHIDDDVNDIVDEDEEDDDGSASKPGLEELKSRSEKGSEKGSGRWSERRVTI